MPRGNIGAASSARPTASSLNRSRAIASRYLRYTVVMDQIEEFADSRLKGLCIHCGVAVDELKGTRDHVPSKCLLKEPYPANLPVVQICRDCNNGFSEDEEYLAAFLGCVLSGSSDPNLQVIAASQRILNRSEGLRQRIESSKREFKTGDGQSRCTWQPESERAKRVLVKNARGHAFYEYGEPLFEDPREVWWSPLESLTAEQRADFEGLNSQGSLAAVPEVGSRMLTRIVTGQDMAGPWILVQDGIYRYAVEQQGRMLVKIVLFEYLAAEIYWED